MTRKSKAPQQVTITMYDVGFGDSFLLSFDYGSDDVRHLLIDCGTSTKTADQMAKTAEQIAEHCGGRLDAVVVTHRHLDHLSAFGSKDAGATLESLKPRLVVQPWTEHPDVHSGDTEAPSVFGAGAAARARSLADAQKFAAHVAEAKPRRDLTFIAELAIKNKGAVKRLLSMGEEHSYVYAGSGSGLEEILQGVTVSVLGPPTVEQSADVKHQAEWNPDEMWKLQAAVSGAATQNSPAVRGASALFPRATTTSVSHATSPVKWFTRKLDQTNLMNVQRIVEDLDSWLNNTSVILLFEFDGQALLFPGDAQVENWAYALGSGPMKERLRRTTLYKVGHHGSTNATPKSLWNLLPGRRASGAHRLVTMLSTQDHKHHLVPRESLVKELSAKSELHSTADLRKKRTAFDRYVIKTAGG
jgi:beta-lactamase superfamily II metal-dependent hydrolase